MLVTFQGVSSLTWLVAIYHTVHIENISVTAESSVGQCHRQLGGGESEVCLSWND